MKEYVVIRQGEAQTNDREEAVFASQQEATEYAERAQGTFGVMRFEAREVNATTQHTPGPLAGSDRSGWYVQWQGGQGFRSAMPDRETAIQVAALADLLATCEWLVSLNDDGNAELAACQDNAKLTIDKAHGKARGEA